MRAHRGKLYASAAALIAASCILGDRASAQSTLPTEEVVVTGTSIRGTQPVGSNLISVGRVDIEKTSAQTVQQILKAEPALSNLGQASQGGGNTTPAIHNRWAVLNYNTLMMHH